MHSTLALVVGLYAFLLIPAAAHAQGAGASDPDLKEVAAYRLSIPALNKVLQATKNLTAAAKNDPRFQKQAALEAEIKKLEAKDELTDADEARLEKLRAEADEAEEKLDVAADTNTLSEMAARIEKEPLAAKALADAGITAREYAKFALAYFQAGMVASLLDSGTIKEVPPELAATMNVENLKFVREHATELEAFSQEMKALEEP